MTLTGDELWAELEKTYCPPIDSALFAAVTSDFNLADPQNVRELRQALDIIKESAIEQEDAIFDPTGTSNLEPDAADLDAIPSERGTFPRGHNNVYSQTEATSMASHVMSSDGDEKASSINSASHIAYTVTADGSLELAGATDDDKIQLLHAMFSGMSRLSIAQTLKKSDGDLDKSMDVLLNLAFFDETQAVQDENQILIPKGIDGFGAGNSDIGRQKGRKKKRSKNQKLPLVGDGLAEASPAPNRWEAGTADIEFISSRTPDISMSKIKSVYHANGMSLSATIRVIALEHVPQETSEVDDDALLVTQMAELGQQFKTVPEDTLIGLLKITRNIISAASELAEILVHRPDPNLADMIKFTATPLKLDDEDEEPMPFSRGRDSESRRAPALSYEQAQSSANAHFAARDSALQQAAQAARRAKSNPLYGGASAVYRQRVQEHRELAMRSLSLASDRLVDQQSIGCDLDLHGVTVANALRITRERVEAWWHALGDTKFIRGGGKSVHGGFKIVTGVGRHSHDGTSRLGPAVSKMLMSEGWRFEIDRGCLLVTGRARN
ncbi:hypothetical protein N7492_005730 [Penicillium capsulatum]|uniref:Smr domain-containing protein n=1 Tax=Penicillium capsulatum TaxID=69766 RepID=A0A9W9IDX5_9EURO|nr:hypothetical protein N7492_005730 [Penicillium capsulatum]KAJ6135172.1 hypothetical protein N7512_000332 [Penicillium capsulatum]